jgi:NH3-dependent NAD+ synthetase
MSLLSRHVSELKSEEFVLGISGGFTGEKGSRFEGVESTKLEIVSRPASKTWNGFKGVEHGIADSSVGASMAERQFPARCMVTFRRVTAVETKTMDGKSVSKDIEKLVVTGIEYLSAVDIVDIKAELQKKAA